MLRSVCPFQTQVSQISSVAPPGVSTGSLMAPFTPVSSLNFLKLLMHHLSASWPLSDNNALSKSTKVHLSCIQMHLGILISPKLLIMVTTQLRKITVIRSEEKIIHKPDLSS